MVITILGIGICLCAGANRAVERVYIPMKNVDDFSRGKTKLVPVVDANTLITKEQMDMWKYMSSDERQRVMRIGERTADEFHLRLEAGNHVR